MTSPLYRRPRRLAGVISLYDLALRVWAPGPERPRQSTSERLRRDNGLSEIEGVPETSTMPHRRR